MKARRGQWSVLLKFVVVVLVVVFWKTFLQLQNMTFDKSGAGDGSLIEKSVTALRPNEAAKLQGREGQAAAAVPIPQQQQQLPILDPNLAADTLEHQRASFRSALQSDYDDVNRVVKDLVQSVTSTCRNVTRPAKVTYAPTGDYWQMNKLNYEHQIYAISAFYDDRPPVGIIPYIRVLAVSTLPKNGTAFCQIWYSGLENPYVTPVIVHSSGRGERVYGIRYGQWLYSCKLPSSLPVPTHVSIAFSACQQTSMHVPIYVPVRSPWQHEFGICVAIAFGRVDPEQIVEWVEINKLFGVSEINIYNASMDSSMDAVFDYYSNTEGILRMHQMPPPQPDYGKKGSKVSSPASLNDCMLRNAYRYRYMVVVDFDEVIVPKKLTNYSAMLDDIDKSNKLTQPWMSYSFRNEFYFYNYAADESHPKFLRTMRYREHAAPNKYLFAPKSFIDPLQCLSVFNHYCLLRFPGSPKKFTIDVSTDIATSHHYKSCSFGSTKCNDYAKDKSKEDYILGVAPQLKERVTRALRHLGLLSGEAAQQSIKGDKVESAPKREKRDMDKKESDKKVDPGGEKLDIKKNGTNVSEQTSLKTNVTNVGDKNSPAKMTNLTKEIGSNKGEGDIKGVDTKQSDNASPNKVELILDKNDTKNDQTKSEHVEPSKNNTQKAESDKNVPKKEQQVAR